MQRLKQLTIAAALATFAFAGASAPAHAQNCAPDSGLCGPSGGGGSPAPILMGTFTGTLLIGSNQPHAMTLTFPQSWPAYDAASGTWQYTASSACDYNDACGDDDDPGNFYLAEQAVVTNNQASVSFSFPDPDRDLTPGSCISSGSGSVSAISGTPFFSLAGTFTLGSGCQHPGEGGGLSLSNEPSNE